MSPLHLPDIFISISYKDEPSRVVTLDLDTSKLLSSEAADNHAKVEYAISYLRAYRDTLQGLMTLALREKNG